MTWGAVQARVTSVERNVEKKADAVLVEANQRAIITRLDRLADQMERHLEASVRPR